MNFEDFDNWMRTSVKGTHTEKIDAHHTKYYTVTDDKKNIVVIAGRDMEVYRLWFDDYHFYSDTAYTREEKSAILSSFKDIIDTLLSGHYYEVVYKRNNQILKRKLFLEGQAAKNWPFIPRKVGLVNRINLLLPGVTKERIESNARIDK